MEQVNRKKMIVFLCVLCGALLVTAAVLLARPQRSGKTVNSGEAPYNITVTFGSDPRTQKNFCWLTDAGDRVSLVQYTEDGGGDPDFADGAAVTAEGYIEDFNVMLPVSGQESATAPELETQSRVRHRVYLSGLRPGTRYWYRVGNGTAWSEPARFETAPDADSPGADGFSFLLFTDTQGFVYSDFEVWARTAESAYDAHGDVSFAVHLGDTVEDQRNALQWQYALSGPRALRSLTVVPVAGNKDDRYVFQYYTVGSPADAQSFGGYYSFDYSGVHFTVLNTGDSEKRLSGAQLRWLESDLASENAQRAAYRLVLIHKAPYSNRNHADDSEIVAIRGQVLPLFEQYGVDVVLEGHDHYYFRSEPVTGNGSTVSAYTQETTQRAGETVTLLCGTGDMGPVYFMPGASGVKQHDKDFRDMPEIHAAVSMLTEQPSYTYCTVTDTEICFLTYEVDRFRGTRTLLEAWGIRRAGQR